MLKNLITNKVQNDIPYNPVFPYIPKEISDKKMKRNSLKISEDLNLSPNLLKNHHSTSGFSRKSAKSERTKISSFKSSVIIGFPLTSKNRFVKNKN